MKQRINAGILHSVLVAQFLVAATASEIDDVLPRFNFVDSDSPKNEEATEIRGVRHGKESERHSNNTPAGTVGGTLRRLGTPSADIGRNYRRVSNKQRDLKSDSSSSKSNEKNSSSQKGTKSPSATKSPGTSNSAAGSTKSTKSPKTTSTKSSKSVKGVDTDSSKSVKSTKNGQNMATAAPVPATLSPTVAQTDDPDEITLVCPDTGVTTINRCLGIETCQRLIVALRANSGLFDFLACVGTGPEVGEAFQTVFTDEGLLTTFETAASSDVALFTGDDTTVRQLCADTPGATCCSAFTDCQWTGSATIASNSCTGSQSCQNIAPNTLVLAGSCGGPLSCQRLHENTGGLTVVGQDACTDSSGCFAVGLEMQGTVLIGDRSCTGAVACNSVGARSGSSDEYVKIGADSCTGTQSCQYMHSFVFMGSKTEGSVFVGDNACTSADICRYAGYDDAFIANLAIDDGDCVPPGTCENCAQQSICMPGETFNADTVTCAMPTVFACS